MKKTLLIFFALIFSFSFLRAQEGGVRIAWDANFDMHFDNREFTGTGQAFMNSQTLFGARLTPALGIQYVQKGGYVHRLMGGVDIFKEFGHNPDLESEGGTGLVDEITFWYRLNKKIGDTDFTMHAGIFPRRVMQTSWSELFFSDSLLFYNPNLEGMLVSFARPKGKYELGCDWIGRKGTRSRERFMLFSAGDSRVLDWLKLGYSAYMYHYAGSLSVRGVVDNILAEPYFEADFAHWLPLQKLSLTAGATCSFSRDRVAKVQHLRGGAELTAEVRKWNVGLRHRLFYGGDMMPLYACTDKAGYPYGNNLYHGNPLFRVRLDGSAPAACNSTELYYEPNLGGLVTLRCEVRAHFNGPFTGHQELVTLRFNIDGLFSLKKQI
ncbi:MAG: hypothetical protein HUJ94_04860 [Bacteroidales bacterium]|nr:hypothetical protein [Bacteroidales bacterium]